MHFRSNPCTTRLGDGLGACGDTWSGAVYSKSGEKYVAGLRTRSFLATLIPRSLEPGGIQLIVIAVHRK